MRQHSTQNNNNRKNLNEKEKKKFGKNPSFIFQASDILSLMNEGRRKFT